MPLARNEAGRLRGMIARLITTKSTLEHVNALHAESDQGFDRRRALGDYQKAREKLNTYISKLEGKPCNPSSE